MAWLSLLLAIVQLTGPFGAAEARAVGLDPLTIEISVELSRSANAVVVRGVGLGGELDPVALSEIEPGRWAGIVELSEPEDITVAFEALLPEGGSIVSDGARLTDLGVDPVVFDLARSPAPPASTPTDDVAALRWLALAVVFGVAALLALGVWSARRPA